MLYGVEGSFNLNCQIWGLIKKDAVFSGCLNRDISSRAREVSIVLLYALVLKGKTGMEVGVRGGKIVGMGKSPYFQEEKGCSVRKGKTEKGSFHGAK